MKNCLFCSVEDDLEQKIIMSNQYCMFLQEPQEVLIGSGDISCTSPCHPKIQG